MELDLADVKPSVLSFLIVGLMASVFIVLAKYVVNRYPVPGVTEYINAI